MVALGLIVTAVAHPENADLLTVAPLVFDNSNATEPAVNVPLKTQSSTTNVVVVCPVNAPAGETVYLPGEMNSHRLKFATPVPPCEKQYPADSSNRQLTHSTNIFVALAASIVAEDEVCVHFNHIFLNVKFPDALHTKFVVVHAVVIFALPPSPGADV